MQKRFKLGWLGRFVVMYFAVVLMLSVFSPVLQIAKSDAASVETTELSKARAATGHIDYSIPSDFGGNILGVNAVYYDYISDEEFNKGWLNPLQAGTANDDDIDSADNWFPFYGYNQRISQYAKSNPSWETPLYFGNFCNTNGSYSDGNRLHNSGGWGNVTNSDNAYKFQYAPNNSNALDNYNVSYQGLMHDKLVNNMLYVNENVPAPYFNNEWLNNNNIAKIIEAEFPFRIENEGGYKKYSFSSKDARDNVYFTWANQNGQTVPTKVNYSDNSSFGVDDGLKYFMRYTPSGKGIFPFNNASSTNKGNKNSNENLNYGFGIRMDIDFRVPTGGLIPNTSQPIKFEFTGDDDLWVYITDNETGTSQLVLDMGGAHKESHGVIDFNAKTATVDLVHPGTEYGDLVSNTGYVYLSKDNMGWSNDSTYAYFFNANGKVGNAWPGHKMSTYGDGNNLRVEIPQGATSVTFNNNSGSQSKDISLSGANGAYWLSSDGTGNQWDDAPDDAGIKSSVVKNFEFDNSTDQKTYTMTVFYMERGLIESNMSINFTMTPLTNDLEVTKDVITTSVNKGIAQELAQNEEFTYTISENNTPAANKGYTHTTSSGTTTSDGKFYLKDDESARFDSQFTIGSAMKVVEDAKSKSGLSYTTSYKLTDKISGDEISSGNSTTSSFNYINSSNSTDSKTSLKLAYTNTPKVKDLKVTKEVVDQNSNDITSTNTEDFTFDIALDLYEADKYNAFDLEYTLLNSGGTSLGNKTATGGTFTLKAGQSAVFKGIPEGTKYKITEQIKDGYSMLSATVNGASAEVRSNTVSGEVKNVTSNAVVVTNQYTPASTSLSAYKTLDGELYTGEDFEFKVTGLPSRNLNGVQTISTSTVSMTASSVTNGLVTFVNTPNNAPFTYGQVGTYCYKIEEVAGDDINYVYDSTVYYAKVEVSSISATGTLTVGTPKYYTDANFTQEIVPQSVLFNNKNATCELRVIKKNVDNETLQGAEFKIVAAKEDGNGKWIQDESSAFVPVTSEVANYDGSYYAQFKDLPQGDYIIIETKAPTGYELSSKEMHVTVKKTAENNGVITVDFSDNPLSWLPKAGGIGVTVFAIIGIGCLLCSFVFLSIQSRKERKAYVGRHYR
ncbi:MAG: starch-binding protein [Ruminococcus sp.]|nr:starch-binding protein [Ruminococcus sp.]